jgi:hypothetical protein
VIAERYIENLANWLAAKPAEPPEWQAAEQVGDAGIYVTPAELTELGQAVQRLVEPYLARTADATLRPQAARLVAFIMLGFPLRPAGR